MKLLKLTLLLLAMILTPFVGNSQGDPCPGDNCVSNDITDISYFLGDENGNPINYDSCIYLDEITAYLYVQFSLNATERYDINSYHDIFIDSAYSHTTNFCMGDFASANNPHIVQLEQITWTCGQSMTIQNILFAWNQQDGGDNPDACQTCHQPKCRRFPNVYITPSYCDLTPIITVSPNIMHGITNFNLTVKITELKQVNTNGNIIVRIPKDVRWGFTYDPNLTNIGGVPLNNSIWSYSSDIDNHIFTSSSVINAGNFSTIGVNATWNAGQTQGVLTITSQIDSYSGGEIRIDNNVDAEKLDYFIN